MCWPRSTTSRFVASIAAAILLKTSFSGQWKTNRQGGNLSVYKHEYRAYTGPVTPLWSRVGVLARYAYAEAWSSKITVGLFTLSMLPVLVYLIIIYIANNPAARMIV